MTFRRQMPVNPWEGYDLEGYGGAPETVPMDRPPEYYSAPQRPIPTQAPSGPAGGFSQLSGGFATPASGGGLNFSQYPVYGGGTGTRQFNPTAGIGFGPGGTSGGPIQYKQPTGHISTVRRSFTGPRPTFEMPERDPVRLRTLRRRAAAPGLRNLRRALQRALVANYENPNVRRMMLRGTLRGYGEGLESVMAGAAREAESIYAQERAEQMQEAMANYQAALTEYMQSGETVTETKSQYGTGEEESRYSGGLAAAGGGK